MDPNVFLRVSEQSAKLASFLGAETVMHMGPIIPDTHWQVLHPRAMALGPRT